MAFIKWLGSATEYQGESFTKSLTKDDDSIWEANETAEFQMTDVDGLEVASGSLVKSADDLSLTFTLGSTDTTALLGQYLLLVYITDTVDAEVHSVIAKYTMTYIDKKAI